MKSILQEKKECYLCRYMYNSQRLHGLESHHMIPGTANRRKSEQYGLKVWLCQEHHRNGVMAVHQNKALMDTLKTIAQREFEKKYSHENWMKEFGKNYM